jgi:hypothetical protein
MNMSVTSMHTDRKAVGHIAKLVGVRALVLNYRRAPEHKFRTQLDGTDRFAVTATPSFFPATLTRRRI